MKNLPVGIIALFLFFSPIRFFLPAASAQSWLWGQKATCGGGSDFIDAWAVTTDPAGNVFGGGFVDGTGPATFGGITIPATPGGRQAVWAKYNSSGTVLWADGTRSGSTYLYNMTTDPAGNLILFGSFTSAAMQIGSFTLTNAYTDGSAQYFLAKVSPSGTVLWAVNDGNSMPAWFSYSLVIFTTTGAVTTDPAGNIYITSSFDKSSITIGAYTLTNSAPGNFDVFVAKYTPSGTVAWASSIGGAENDCAYGITASSTGNIYVAGSFSSASIAVGGSVISNPYSPRTLAYIAKFSPAGVPIWGQGAGGSRGAFAVGLAKDNFGNVYMTGGFADTSISFGSVSITRTYATSVPEFALFLVQYSSADVVTWSKSISSPNQGVWGYSVALASCGQVWVSGNYNENAAIGIGDILPLVPGADPVFIAGYDLSGSVVGYSGLGSGGDDQNEIACDASGNVYLCSDYSTASIFSTFIIGPDTLTGPLLAPTESFYLGKYSNAAAPDTTTETDTFCNETTGVMLKATPGYSAYYWDDGSFSPTRTVTDTGKYYVYCMTCGATIHIDSFSVINPDTTVASRDTSACISVGTINLNAPDDYSSFLWNTGVTSASTPVTKTGSYWVQASGFCSILTDTFNVIFVPLPIIGLGNDTGFCPGQAVTLKSLQPPGSTFVWNTGSTSDSISITTAGTYWLTVNNGTCNATDSINVTALSTPAPVDLGPDTTLCLGNTLELSSTAATDPLLWSNGAMQPSISVTETGSYWATISNSCGISSDTIKVNFELCDIWFPNAFTPNGDGKNDIARVVGSFNFFTDFSLSIYNRYGQRVFYTRNIYDGWDGTFNGVKQDLGTYFYMIEYTLEGHKHMMKGDLELIR